MIVVAVVACVGVKVESFSPLYSTTYPEALSTAFHATVTELAVDEDDFQVGVSSCVRTAGAVFVLTAFTVLYAELE